MLEKQEEIRAHVVVGIDSFLADAEFQRARSISLEMRDVEIKRKLLQEFTTKN